MKKLLLLLLGGCTYNLSIAQWTNGQSAFRVLGQPNLTSNTGDDGSEVATTLDGCSGIAIDVANGKIYVVDEDNHRVLRYAYPITSDQQAADLVFGQANFVSTTSGATQNKFFFPSGVAVDNTGRLWVGDGENKRVVWFNAAHSISSNQPNADGVLGQSDFGSRTAATTQSGMNSLEGISISSTGTLYVADESNNRVLRFDNAALKSNGANADGVLGQPDFTSSGTSTTQSGLVGPNGVFIDATGTLWVASPFNDRVLRFDNAASKANGANADGVLGQSNFTSSAGATTQSGMRSPMDVAVDGSGRLYVTELNNNRVTIFNNAASKANGANADNVLGQANFTTSSSGITASTMTGDFRSSVAVDNTNGILWVSDSGNNRAIAFQASSALPVEISWFKGQAISTGNLLTWQTSSELINEGFEIQKAVGNAALEAGRWQVLAFVEGHGTTNEVQNYSYTDEHPQAGLNYYRLKQIDFDGKFDYSDIVSVDLTNFENLSNLRVFPNPAPSDELTLHLSESNCDPEASGLGQKAIIRLYDQTGRLALQQTTSSKQQTLNISLLSAGIYLVEVTVGGKVFREKVVVE